MKRTPSRRGASGSSPERTTTPMMEQYLRVKAQAPEALLLYRMGDFYETFYEDAVTLSRVLGVALTSRNAGDPEPIPLAGIPWHSAEPQIARLLAAGMRVAICEQVESAPTSKGLIDRRIVEVLSPGTAVAEPLLEGRRHNFLVALCGAEERIGLAAADISTGTFLAGDLTTEEAEEELLRLAPAEVLLPEGWEAPRLLRWIEGELPNVFRSRWDAWRFAPARGAGLLREHFRVATLDGYGFSEIGASVGAAAAVLEYAREQRRSELSHLRGLVRIRPSGYLILDEASLRGLEVFTPLGGGGKDATLISVLDRTRTAPGARRLRDSLARPYRDPEPARARQNRVGLLVADAGARESLARALSEVSDIERILARVHCARATPRDLGALRTSLLTAPKVAAALPSPETWGGVEADLAPLDLSVELDRALLAPPPLRFEEEIFRDHYDETLDELRAAARGGRQWMLDLEASERERSGIANLKVGYNRVFGYYIEVTRSQLGRVPARYTRKQTLSTGERFITPELKEQEERILGAHEAHARRQEELFRVLCERVAERTEALQRTAGALAEIDLVLALAEIAAEGGYVRPVLTRTSGLRIEEGRHPVVERAVGLGSFVPNDIDLDGDERQIILLTGPNMAGKSTYLRQVGLIVVLAQMGSYVPARAAEIGIVDRIFTRVGAHDLLARGQSTFLVEMIETSNILRHATSESLVLMDEVGRGTSTYDGVSIAWAVAEALRGAPDRRPRTIFATHYHELTRLGEQPGYVNRNVTVREWGDQVIFLRKVEPGAADKSYGIEVARLAGVPDAVVERAKEVLRELESYGARGIDLHVPSGAPPPAQLTLFTPSDLEWLREELARIDPERMTPMEALERIHRWAARVDAAARRDVSSR